jgi:hypothetical protein
MAVRNRHQPRHRVQGALDARGVGRNEARRDHGQAAPAVAVVNVCHVYRLRCNSEYKGTYKMNDKQVSSFLGRGSSSRGSMTSIVALIALGAGVANWGAVPALAGGSERHIAKAIAARTISVHEIMHTDEVISHKGNTAVDERGRGTGTYFCAVIMKMTISYTSGTVDMSCSTSSGNLSAGGKVSFFTSGTTGTFTGTLTPQHGTGKYTHASGRLHVEGSMVRKTFALSATMSGVVTY